jgi:ABC-type polar amino acid transport system ATPase subunit
MTAFLTIERIDKWFGALHVLRDVSLDVAEGERIVICGPSGSGKSTLVNCINGLQPYQGGEIRVAGVLVSEALGTAHGLRRHIGMVFQQFNLFPHLTALENCCIAPRRVLGLDRGTAARRARAALDRVHVGPLADRYPAQLSGGQQQRVAIARALCMQPSLMLFDEPTSALDPEMVGEVLDAIIDLSQTGMTTVCVTHEMGFTRKLADRVVLMEDGAVMEVAPPDRFFDPAVAGPRVRSFLDKVMRA